jgi:hypothetical protein
MKKSYWFSAFLLPAFIICSTASGQGLLNKLKNKANQEVNKLENKVVSPTGSQGTKPNKNKLSANVTRTVVVTLGADENFDYSENCIDLGASLNQVSFIINKQNGSNMQCFAYKNGVRTPVACPSPNSGCATALQCSYAELKEVEANGDDIKKYVINDTESHNIQMPAVSDQQMKAMAAYMTPEQVAEMKKSLAAAQKETAGKSFTTIKSSTINFNGKKYGPYKQVSRFFLTQDAKNFYAIVTEVTDAKNLQVHSKMISSGSATVLTLPDYVTPMLCLASADNLQFAYTTFGQTGQSYVIATSTGKTYEIPATSGFNGAWFSASGGHLLYLSGNQLYVDGKSIKTFPSDASVSACDLFLTADGTGVTMIKDNTVSFADGDYFEYPLTMAIVSSGGKQYYKWLALENREVVVYQKPY